MQYDKIRNGHGVSCSMPVTSQNHSHERTEIMSENSLTKIQDVVTRVVANIPKVSQEEEKNVSKPTKRRAKPLTKFAGAATNLMQTDQSELEKGYTARAVVIASMPHSKPKETFFERKNGNYTFRMIADPKVG